MADEPDTIRPLRGAAVGALALEDLDVYGVAELEERAVRLREEIARTDAAAARKRSERNAADALFGVPKSSVR